MSLIKADQSETFIKMTVWRDPALKLDSIKKDPLLEEAHLSGGGVFFCVVLS